MEISPDVPAIRKHPQLAALRHWRDVTSPARLLLAAMPPHNLISVSQLKVPVQALDGYARQLLAELGGSP